MRRCKTPKGWRAYPVAMSANGRIKQNTVVVDGKEMVFPEGHYTMRHFEGKKTKWTPVKGGSSEALAALKAAQSRATLLAMADDIGVEVVKEASKRMTIPDAAQIFLDSVLARDKKEAHEVYAHSLKNFMNGCTKKYLDEIDNHVMVQFELQMRKEGLKPRTVFNRHMHIRTFLTYWKRDVKDIAGRPPKFDLRMPKVFDKRSLRLLYAHLSSPYDKLFYHFLLGTGLRDKEARYVEWKDIDFVRGTLLVESKPRYKHRIKDHEERELPLTPSLLKKLARWKTSLPEDFRLIFGRRRGTIDEPEGHHLRQLKDNVRNAGLNCGRCEGCTRVAVATYQKRVRGSDKVRVEVRKAAAECSEWKLHRFRATYITTLLRNGVDIRTVMQLSGHADLETVMRYLRPAEGEELRGKMNRIEWGMGDDDRNEDGL